MGFIKKKDESKKEESLKWKVKSQKIWEQKEESRKEESKKKKVKSMTAKHFIRDLLIVCFSILGLSFLYRRYMRQKGPLVRVICFHDVSDRTWFESTIDTIQTRSNILTPDAFHKNEFDPEQLNVLITFDDGYQSWIDVALPVLAERNMKALFFVNSGLLDVAEDSEKSEEFMRSYLRIRPRKPLTWGGAQALVMAGHTIGGHSTHHHDLISVSEDVCRREIQDDRNRITSILGVVPIDFAYPFGTRSNFNTATRKCATDAGYTHIYIAETGFLSGPKTEVPRTLVELGQSRASLTSWLYGGYDIFAFIARKLR